jgi:hypothetical protein
MKKRGLKYFLFLSGVTFAIASFAQIATRPFTPTISGYSQAPVSGHTANAVNGFTQQPVNGFRPTPQIAPLPSLPQTLNRSITPELSSPISGFTPNAVSGFSGNQRPVIQPNVVATPSPVSGFSQSPVSGFATNVPAQQFSTNISRPLPGPSPF